MSSGLINSTKRVSVTEEGPGHAHFTYVSLLLMFSKTFSPTQRKWNFGFIHKIWSRFIDLNYMWLKMAFKMFQEFPTATLDITEDFLILRSAYVYVCYSILKAKTYNWLPNTHTHTHTHTWLATTTNKKQLGTSHLLLMVISLAQTLLSCAKFPPLRVIKKKRGKKL